MNDDKQYKKTLRLIVVSFLLGLTGLIAFATWFSIQLTTLQKSMNTQKVTFIDGKNGQDGATVVGPIGDRGPKGNEGDTGPKGDTGATGLQGVQGIDGANGVDGKNGLPGPQGDSGSNGREIELCYLPDNTTVGQRFKGDSGCTAIPKNPPASDTGNDEEVVWAD